MLAFFIFYLPCQCRQKFIGVGLEPACEPAGLWYLPARVFYDSGGYFGVVSLAGGEDAGSEVKGSAMIRNRFMQKAPV
jgi:hypothetical protein